MSNLSKFLFTCYYCSWLIIHFFRWIHHPVPWFNNYLTDLAAVPLIAHIVLYVIREFVVHHNHYCLPLSYLLFIAVYTSIVFEGIMPALSARYTRDMGDVAAYLFGALFYYFVHQRNFRSPIS
ncbi:hypothetical protein A8C56_10795 [Niabella ginsenosidivorans]|uniref:Magnesium citrate secondary transporter n=1 Tax=Niabella ginsenosidivorans TaxID=1176587 RepID=A0A1A9I167_9BACT|nr:hypothetical protein [Niabella ginsenosidivorans]ANH81407.1 hypothetical protein A8C56_10795 [Niabella ginsenosidivorans]